MSDRARTSIAVVSGIRSASSAGTVRRLHTVGLKGSQRERAYGTGVLR